MSPRQGKKARSSSSSTSSAGDSPRPFRTRKTVQQRHQQQLKHSLSTSLRRSVDYRPPSPPKPQFSVYIEPLQVGTRMRAHLPTRDRKRKRSIHDSSSEDDEEEEVDLASSTASSFGGSGMRRTRSSAKIEECVRGVKHIQFSDDEDANDTENELGDPDDEYYLHHAFTSQLTRLRKDKLVELWNLLLQDYPASQHAQDNADVDPDELSKQALVSAILQARDSPRSSPALEETALRGPTRSTSLPSVFLDDAPRPRARHTRSTSMAEAQSQRRSGRVLRSASSDQLAPRLSRTPMAFDFDLEDIEEDRSMREPTPVAKRTRASTTKADPAHESSEESSTEGSDGDAPPLVLRSGRTVAVEEPAEVEEVSFEAADSIAPESEAAASDEEAEEDHEESAFDFQIANFQTLLRLKRDELVTLCEERELARDGTKKDLATRLLEWRDAQSVASEDSEEEGAADGQSEADSSFRPDGSFDTSFVSNADASDEEASQAETETELMPPPKTIRARKNETKTQALAKVDKTSQTRDGTTPLLEDSHRAKRRPRPPEPEHPQSDSEEEEEEENAVGLDLESLNLQDKAIAPGALVKGEKIGSGGFKDVFKGKYRNVRVAIADIRGHLTENEIKELELLRDLRHENIVKLIGVVAYDPTSPIPCSLVTELCLNGDLFDYVRRDVPPPSFDKILKIMLDIASGLDYLHNRIPKIIHRDMKSSNVLITAKGVAKLTDFGLARVKNSTRSIIKSLVGTVNWQAPELWVPHPRYNQTVDCYAAGMVYWEMLQWHVPVKKYPFEGMNEHAIYQEVGQRQQRPPTSGIARQWGSGILQLVNRMWAQSPTARPSMSEVVDELRDLLADFKTRR